MVCTMLALDLEAAKKLAIVLVIGFALLSLAAGIIIKNVVMKLIMCLLLAGLALGAWSQRSTLQSCADDVRARAGDGTTITCTFFGSDIDV